MGLFRLILAFAVLLSHIPDLNVDTFISRDVLPIKVWSGHAVFAFFIISGFYISMVFSEKYSKLSGGTQKFYLNRALRLYPAHWVILILYTCSFLWVGADSFLLGDFKGEPLLGLTAYLSNVFFLGVEWIPFFNTSNWYYVLGPVWSLSLEVYFYLLAPYIVMRSLRTIIGLVVVFLCFRLFLYGAGVETTPWRYFFFPSVFVFFLMGVLSYRVYNVIKDKRFSKYIGGLCLVALIFYCSNSAFWIYSDHDMLGSWSFYLLVWISIPFIFNLTKKNKIDNFIGQLTYPIYLGHMLIITIVLNIDTTFDKGLLVVIGSVLLAILLYLFVDKPINRKFRDKISQ